MFQVLVTIFFSAAVLTAAGVIAAMLTDNAADVGRALGLAPMRSVPSRRVRARRAVPARAATPRAPALSPLRAAA